MADPGIAAAPPIAEGQAAMQHLSDAGFSNDEIMQYQNDQTARLNAAGFKPDEIDAYWGRKPAPTGPTDKLAEQGILGSTVQQIFDFEKKTGSLLAAGAQNSDLGLLVRGKVPDKIDPKDQDLYSMIVRQLGESALDFPVMMVGAAGGAAGGASIPGAGESGIPELVGAGAGANALPQAIRETLIDYYQRGEIHDFKSFWAVFSGSLIRTLKAGVVGGVMGPAGKFAGAFTEKVGGKVAGQIADPVGQVTAAVTTGAALDGRVPDAKDFISGAVLMLAAHGAIKGIENGRPTEAAQRVQANLQKLYKDRGITPWDAVQRAQKDPVIRQEIMQQDPAGEPVHPKLTRESPPEPTPFHQPPTPTPKPRTEGTPEAEAPVFKTNPLAGEEGRGAHIAPDVEHLLPLVKSLEGSGDSAISPAGAIGRFQIMPATARQYGFDPAKLTDPVYNERAARAILTDLYHRYNGVVDDILVAYNAGPGRANAWRASGRPMAKLPLETQKYLEHSDKINGWTSYGGGGGGEPPPGGPEKIEGPEADPFKLSTESLQSIVHDIVGEPKPPASVFKLDTMYRQFVSELGPAKNIDKLLEAEGMLKPGDNRMNTQDMFRQTYGSDQRAGFFVKFGTLTPTALDKNGQDLVVAKTSDNSFAAAYRLAAERGGDEAGFDAYRIAKRTVEKAGQGIKTGVDPKVAEALVEKTEKTYGPASKMMNKTKDASLDYARESGLFSPEQVARIKALNEHHVTFRRLMGEDEVPLQARGRGFRPNDPLKAMEGGDAKIMDPLTADIDNLHRVITMADRNRAVGHVIGAVEAHAELGAILGLKKLPPAEVKATLAEPGSNIFKPYNIDDPKDQAAFQPFIAARAFQGARNANRFVYFRDGKPEVWEANDPDLAALMRGSDAKPEMDFFTKTATFFAKTQRSGITITPDYAGRITFRHQVTAAIFDKNGGIPFSDFMHGVTHVLKQDDVYQRWVANGGAGTALVDMDTNYIKRDFNDIMEKTNSWNSMYNVVRHPIQFSQLISERMDAAGRVGYMLRNEGDLGTMKAATGGRMAQLDYVEKGTSAIANWMARTTPFQRPHILGLKQAYEAFTERPAQTMLKVATWVTLPTVGLYVLNYLQDKYGNLPDAQKYENLPRWERDTLYIAPSIGGWRPRLMMPPVVGPIFGGMVNRMLDYSVKQDPHAFEDWGKSVLAEFLPPVIPQVALPVAEHFANYNYFGQKAIVPDQLHANNSAPMQYTEGTTEAARMLSRLLDHANVEVSPMMIENYVKEWAGSGGMAILRVLNAPLGGTQAPWQPADTPFLNSFLIRNPGMSAQPIQDFYTSLDKFNKAHGDLAAAMQRAEETGDMTELQRYAPNPQAYISMIGVEKALHAQREAIIATTHDDKLTVDEKRQALDAEYAAAINTAKFGLQIMDATK